MGRVSDRTQFKIDLIMCGLAILTVAFLILPEIISLSPRQVLLLKRFDLIVCTIFWVEFLFFLGLAESRKEFVKLRWYDPVGAIPFLVILRPLRLMRLVRIIRLLRVLRIGALFTKSYKHFTGFVVATKLIQIMAVASITTLIGAWAFFILEAGTNTEVKSFLDAVWWALATVTTVGYGDIVPETPAGKAIGMFLMVFGIGLFVTLTSMIAAYIIKHS